MQTIEHKYKHELKTLRQVEELYTLMSDYNYINNIRDIAVSDIFINIVEDFVCHTLIKRPWYFKDKYDTIPTLKDDKFMLVCASGGKDSTAVAKYYMAKGYEVILYHMKGINQAYYDEHKAVEKIAEDLDVPYFIDDVRLIGKHMYVEHPMKNMLIANGAIQYCLEFNMPVNIAFGNYQTSKLEDMEFEIDGGDSRDMWDMYEEIIRNEIPDFKIHTPLKSINDTYDILYYHDDLVEDSISCMSPYRFRKHWKERTEKKYGVDLLPNRCGCCAKCCLEYMVLVDMRYLRYNEDYYRYCFGRLWKIAEKETGVKAKNIDQIWNRYFWYDISESHLKIEI